MEKEEERQRKRQENIVQIIIIAVGFVIAALFLASYYSSSSVQIYNVEGDGAVSEASSARAEEKEESDDDDWEGSSDWSAEASAGTALEMVSSSSTASSESGELEVLLEKSIDINRAGKDELDKLPGIGPVLAERIIHYREENGGYSDIEELKSVDGIGDKTFEKVRDYVIAG